MTRVIQYPRRLAATCFGVLLTVVGAAMAAASFTNTDVAGWIEALATLSALVAAIVAAVYAAGALRLELKRDAERRDEHRAAQAGLVSVWGHADYRDVVQNGARVAKGGRVTVSIRNASELPVTQMVLTIQAAPAKGDPYDQQIGTDRVFLGEHRVHIVPPANEPIDVHLPMPDLGAFVNDLRRADPQDVAILAISARFRDAAGLVWNRSETGELLPVKPS